MAILYRSQAIAATSTAHNGKVRPEGRRKDISQKVPLSDSRRLHAMINWKVLSPPAAGGGGGAGEARCTPAGAEAIGVGGACDNLTASAESAASFVG